MRRPANSPDTDDAHVRHLLDQRFARADPFGCYSSSTISEASDTPSVYSRAFSPRPAVHADSLTDSYLHTSSTSPCQSRLYDDPTSSVLDLSEDSHSSMALHQPYGRDDGIDDHEKSLEVNEDEDGLPRGPKMRFHSRAPWELEGDSLEEEVNGSESGGSTTLMAMLTGGRSKGSKTDTSSPRPSTSVGRPSLESSRSILISKRSFDTSSLSHPRGALYALAQESISTSSLGQAHHFGRQDRPRGKFSLGLFQSRSPVDTKFPGQPVIQDDHSLVRSPSPPRPSVETTSSALDIQAGLNPHYLQHRSNDDSFHPYANPDLVNSYTTDTRSECSHQSFVQQPGVFRHDSIMTVTDTSLIPPSKPAPPPTQDASPVPLPKRRMSHINGRDISSPVPIRSTSLGPNPPSQLHCDHRPETVSPMPNAIPGWSERQVNPGYSLISLEEARAQRPRPAPVQAPPSSSDSPPSSGGSLTLTPFHADAEPDAHSTDAFVDSDMLHVSGSESTLAARQSRTRSISAGAKAMNALQSIVKQSERKDPEASPVTGQTHTKDTGSVSGGKNLKHRKSGFLRLFGNSGKEDRPPPVPAVPSQLSTTNTATAESLKPSPRRVPVPNVSPSLLDIAPQRDSDGSSSSSGRSNSRRLAPSLSINTASSSPVRPPPRGSSISAFSSQATIPQSAPAHASDFPTLKLRPVSSLFSEHFADHIDIMNFNLDAFDGAEQKTTSKTDFERQQERPRQDSLASGSVSSALTSESGTSFTDSQYIITSARSPNTSTPVTALTTPTTPGLVSPMGTWHRDRDRGGGRESIDQYSAPPSSHASSNMAASAPDIIVGRETSTVKILQEHLDNTNKMWQKRVWELEKQIAQLKVEVAELKGETHGKEKPLLVPSHRQKTSAESVAGVINRPRARTGGSSRFVNGQL